MADNGRVIVRCTHGEAGESAPTELFFRKEDAAGYWDAEHLEV